nr:hypothetical protein CFP56_64698 [Quercus suber]
MRNEPPPSYLHACLLHCCSVAAYAVTKQSGSLETHIGAPSRASQTSFTAGNRLPLKEKTRTLACMFCHIGFHTIGHSTITNTAQTCIGPFRTPGRTCNPTPLEGRAKGKTYNSEDSHVVTHRTTNSPVDCLYMAERTGCLVLSRLWSYVLSLSREQLYGKRWKQWIDFGDGNSVVIYFLEGPRPAQILFTP